MSGQPGRSGRKTFVPTADQRNAVKTMSALGISEDKIRLAIINPQTGKPLSAPTLRARLRQLGEALIPRGTKCSNPASSAAESVAVGPADAVGQSRDSGASLGPVRDVRKGRAGYNQTCLDLFL